jgi:hypothetical protein
MGRQEKIDGWECAQQVSMDWLRWCPTRAPVSTQVKQGKLVVEKNDN